MAPTLSDIGSHLGGVSALGKSLGDDVAGGASKVAAPDTVTDDHLAGAAASADKVDTSPVGAAVSQLAERAAPLIGALPVARDVLGPLAVTLELVEKATEGDLESAIKALSETLSRELAGARSEGFVGILVKIGGVLASAPELKALVELLATLAKSTGVDVAATTRTVADALPALDGTIRCFGGLMSLESTLAESERLASIMASQLDPASARRDLAGVVAAFGGAAGPLVHFVADIDPSKPAEVDAASAAIGTCIDRLEQLRASITDSMALGEATLVFLDVTRVQAELGGAAAIVRGLDAAPLERAARSLADRLGPIASVDLAAAPNQGLDWLLSQVEAKVADIAAAVGSLDAARIVQPVHDGLESVNAVLGGIGDALAKITLAVRGALDRVRAVVAALPFDDVTHAIGKVIEPIRAAMDFLKGVIDQIGSGLDAAANATTDALKEIEQAIEKFESLVEKAFGDAAELVRSVGLAQKVGDVSDDIKKFADELGKAQMKPYFDTAVGVIGTTADVISAIPLGLLPDSMKSKLDEAVKPVREIDVPGVRDEVESFLEIKDGKLALTGPLKDELAALEDAYQHDVLDVVAAADPRALKKDIENARQAASQEIEKIKPRLTLKPVRDAVDKVKGAIAAFDPRAELKPVDEAFAKIGGALDEYSPQKLLAGIEDRIAQARAKAKDTVRLDQWSPALDTFLDRATGLLDVIDPARLEPQLVAAATEARQLLARLPDQTFAGGLGELVALLLAGSGLRVHPWAFDAVIGWIGDGSGSKALTARAGRIADAVARTRDDVETIDLATAAAAVSQTTQALRLAIKTSKAVQLEPLVDRLESDAVLARLSTNRDRYLASLRDAAARAAELRRLGLSEVDDSIGRLGAAIAPARALGAFLRELLARLGITGLDRGIGAALAAFLDVATPARVIAILSPILAALRSRLQTLLSAVVAPIKEGIAKTTAIIDAIDLAPLETELQSVYDEARRQIDLISPTKILGPALADFDALRADVVAFDPLAKVTKVIDELEATIDRVLGRLDADVLLESPIKVFDEIDGALKKIDLQRLLAPVFDQLDAIARQVDDGLGQTTDALVRLQQALPGGGGA